MHGMLSAAMLVEYLSYLPHGLFGLFELEGKRTGALHQIHAILAADGSIHKECSMHSHEGVFIYSSQWRLYRDYKFASIDINLNANRLHLAISGGPLWMGAATSTL